MTKTKSSSSKKSSKSTKKSSKSNPQNKPGGMTRLAQKNAEKRKKEARRQKAAAANAPQKMRISDEEVREMILMLCAASYPDSAVRPEDIAMELNPMEWQDLLKRVRLFARQLTHAGDLEILRKGEPVDPDTFKGVYRLRTTPQFIEGIRKEVEDPDQEDGSKSEA